MVKQCGIYKITIGEYFYVGSSQDIHKRVYRHLSDLRKSVHRNRFMQRVYDKHLDMSFTVLEIVSVEDLLNVEQAYLCRYYTNTK